MTAFPMRGVLSRRALALLSNVPESTIRRIEQGSQRMFPMGLPRLKAIARALGMNDEETEVFLSLVSFSETDLRHQSDPHEAELILKEVERRLTSIALPAFVGDEFLDVLVANSAALQLYQFTPERLAHLRDTVLPNAVYFILSSQMGFASMIREKGQDMLAANIRLFLRSSLPYQDECYWRYLFESLLYNEQDPILRRRFEVSLAQARRAAAGSGNFERRYRMRLPSGEEAHFWALVVDQRTPYGTLFYIFYIPADAATTEIFARFSEKSTHFAPVRLAPWPLDRKIIPPDWTPRDPRIRVPR
ncbi:MAG: helix-turn-helix transcriptional regulator [Chloroflexi bacterium]|nr:helix-turn-helix transcriptional regulator [Chloroflexota bacterium]